MGAKPPAMKSWAGLEGGTLSSKKKRQAEYEEKIKQAIEILQIVAADNTTPRNIRRAAKECIDRLQSDKLSIAARSANAMEILEEISQDPNMPIYTRTRLWQAISYLEGIKD